MTDCSFKKKNIHSSMQTTVSQLRMIELSMNLKIEYEEKD